MGKKPDSDLPAVREEEPREAILLQAEHPEATSIEQILGKAGYEVARFGSQNVAILAYTDLTKLISRVRLHKSNQPGIRIIAGLEKRWDTEQVRRRLNVYGVRHFYRFPLIHDDILEKLKTLT